MDSYHKMLTQPNMSSVKVTFWGTRGSYPIASPKTIGVGGRTSCVSLESGQQLVILDAGTGLIALGEDPRIQHYDKAAILLSHVHHDHIMGTPFFKPIWLKDWKISFYSGVTQAHGGLEHVLKTCFSPPYFPVPWADFPAQCHYQEFQEGDTLIVDQGISAATIALDHPGGACGYRVSMQDVTVVYLTDTKHNEHLSHDFISFSQGADLLIYDSTFTDSEFALYPDWGHSTWKQATVLANAAQVKCLALFHHNPDHCDEEMKNILKQAQTEFGNTILARDGLELSIS